MIKYIWYFYLFYLFDFVCSSHQKPLLFLPLFFLLWTFVSMFFSPSIIRCVIESICWTCEFLLGLYFFFFYFIASHLSPFQPPYPLPKLIFELQKDESLTKFMEFSIIKMNIPLNASPDRHFNLYLNIKEQQQY